MEAVFARRKEKMQVEGMNHAELVLHQRLLLMLTKMKLMMIEVAVETAQTVTVVLPRWV